MCYLVQLKVAMIYFHVTNKVKKSAGTIAYGQNMVRQDIKILLFSLQAVGVIS